MESDKVGNVKRYQSVCIFVKYRVAITWKRKIDENNEESRIMFQLTATKIMVMLKMTMSTTIKTSVIRIEVVVITVVVMKYR